MSHLFEIIGYVAAYVVCVFALAYGSLFVVGTFVKGGLEVLALAMYVFFGVLIVGAAVGLFLLGRLI